MLDITDWGETTERDVTIEVRSEHGDEWFQVDRPHADMDRALRRAVELVERAPEVRGHLRLRARAVTTTVTEYAGTLMEVR